MAAGKTARRTAARKPGARVTNERRRLMKVSDVIASEIVHDFVKRGLKSGDRLPLETEMMAQFRVSRSSMREGLRLLEAQGVVRTRPGCGGGSVIGSVDVGNLRPSLTLHMHLVGATYGDLLEGWVQTEAMLAELAASNPNRAQVKRAMAPFLTDKRKSTPREKQWEFHHIINTLANNRVLAFVLLMPAEIVREHISSAVARETMGRHIAHSHADIARAVAEGNARKAYTLMHDHVEHLVAYYRRQDPGKLRRKIEWR